VKIVIKGDRNTGKSCLMKQLQGAPFRAEYTPTPEIEVRQYSVAWMCTTCVRYFEKLALAAAPAPAPPHGRRSYFRRACQVANISWKYKVSDDIVKVEVWDIVDKGIKKKADDAPLKLEVRVPHLLAPAPSACWCVW